MGDALAPDDGDTVAVTDAVRVKDGLEVTDADSDGDAVLVSEAGEGVRDEVRLGVGVLDGVRLRVGVLDGVRDAETACRSRSTVSSTSSSDPMPGTTNGVNTNEMSMSSTVMHFLVINSLMSTSPTATSLEPRNIVVVRMLMSPWLLAVACSFVVSPFTSKYTS